MAGGFFDHALQLVWLPDIAHNRMNGGAELFNLFAGALQLSLIARSENKVATVASELFRQRQSQSARSAGNEHGLAADIISAKIAKLSEKTASRQESSHASGSARHQCSGCNSAQNGYALFVHNAPQFQIG
jgi:hypothetical protein